MKDVTSEKYLKKASNIYLLVIAASKRASALSRGEKSFLPDTSGIKYPSVALEEIIHGRLEYKPIETHASKKK